MFVVDAQLLDLGDMDVVVGVDWLEKHGNTTMDWKMRTLNFEDNGAIITFKGYQLSDGVVSSVLERVASE